MAKFFNYKRSLLSSISETLVVEIDVRVVEVVVLADALVDVTSLIRLKSNIKNTFYDISMFSILGTH